MEYNVNKGIDKPAEFCGLRAQYLVFFAGGLIAVFLLFVILYMIGIHQGVCIGFCIVAAGALVWSVFYLNHRYGQFGVMKLQARQYRPRYIINRKRISRIVTRIF